jgi:hypothetical protein
MNALGAPAAAGADPPTAGRYTVHDHTVENVSAVVDQTAPWVVRENGRFHIIVGRYETRIEADCAALALNHAVTARALEAVQ